MKNKKVLIFVVLALIFFDVNIYAQEKSKIVLGCETSILPSAVWIAENKGYFHEEGLNIEIEEFGSGRTALKTMLEEGGLDMVTAAQTPVVFNSFKRNDYAITAGMVYSYNDVFVLARKDRGIKTPSDLKGKTIGISKGSTGHFFLGLFLIYNDMDISSVQILDLEATKLAEALDKGGVDAISTWQPHISNAKKALGENALLLPTGGIFREDFYFISSKNFIKTHPETLKKFLRAIEKGEAFIQKNKMESIKIVSERLKTSPDIVTAAWDEYVFQLFLDQAILVCLEDEARWMIDNKLTDKTVIPNYLDYIYIDALDEVKTEAVTIIR
jgi:NitT/TauT family transport system substrate-binding protein